MIWQQRNYTLLELKVRLLKYFESNTEGQHIEIGEHDSVEILTVFASDNAEYFIAESINKWMANQMPSISRNQIVLEDISLINL